MNHPLGSIAQSDAAVIVAPIQLRGGSRILAVLVENRDENRLYLHEACIKENLQTGLSFKTGAFRQSGAKSGDMENMRQDIFTVTPESVSKDVDKDGEPGLSLLFMPAV